MFRQWLKKHRIMRKGTAFAVLLAFFASFIATDAWSVAEIGEVSYTAEMEGPPPLQAETFTIPDYLATVRDYRKGTTNKMIIHIQDAHCNYDAQRRISEIIDYLTSQYGITEINLEGGKGAYDLAPFTGIINTDIRETVSDYFVKEGTVTGAEYFAINNPDRVTLWGVEEAKLYMDNLSVYRGSLAYKEEAEGYLKNLSHLLSNLKMKIYSKGLFDLDLKYSQYKANNLDFKDYLTFLLEKAKERGIIVKEYPNIYLLTQSLEQEKEINFKRANDQRDELVDSLQKILSKRSLEELVKNTVDFKAKRLSQYDYYEFLLERANLANIKLESYPDLQKYIVYISLYHAADKAAIMAELTTLEEDIKATLFQNDTQRNLSVLSKNLTLEKNMFAFSFTKEDWEYYSKNKASFGVRNFSSFIKREAPKYKITAQLDRNVGRLDGFRDKLEKFFSFSFKRDDAFLENLRFKGQKEGIEAAIIVTGGFHTENLCALFRKKGISYVSLMPNFTNKEGYVSPYFALLGGGVGGLEKKIDAAFSSIQVASKFTSLGEAVDGTRGIDRFRLAGLILTGLEEGKGEAIAVRHVDSEGKTHLITFSGTAETGINIDDKIVSAEEVAGEFNAEVTVAADGSLTFHTWIGQEYFADPQLASAKREALVGSPRQGVLKGAKDFFISIGRGDIAEKLEALANTENRRFGGMMVSLVSGIRGFDGQAGAQGIHISGDITNDDELTALLIHEAIAYFFTAESLRSMFEGEELTPEEMQERMHVLASAYEKTSRGEDLNPLERFMWENRPQDMVPIREGMKVGRDFARPIQLGVVDQFRIELEQELALDLAGINGLLASDASAAYRRLNALLAYILTKCTRAESTGNNPADWAEAQGNFQAVIDNLGGSRPYDLWHIGIPERPEIFEVMNRIEMKLHKRRPGVVGSYGTDRQTPKGKEWHRRRHDRLRKRVKAKDAAVMVKILRKSFVETMRRGFQLGVIDSDFKPNNMSYNLEELRQLEELLQLSYVSYESGVITRPEVRPMLETFAPGLFDFDRFFDLSNIPWNDQLYFIYRTAIMLTVDVVEAHPELAHEFLDDMAEAGIAAEIVGRDRDSATRKEFIELIKKTARIVAAGEQTARFSESLQDVENLVRRRVQGEEGRGMASILADALLDSKRLQDAPDDVDFLEFLARGPLSDRIRALPEQEYKDIVELVGPNLVLILSDFMDSADMEDLIRKLKAGYYKNRRGEIEELLFTKLAKLSIFGSEALEVAQFRAKYGDNLLKFSVEEVQKFALAHPGVKPEEIFRLYLTREDLAKVESEFRAKYEDNLLRFSVEEVQKFALAHPGIKPEEIFRIYLTREALVEAGYPLNDDEYEILKQLVDANFKGKEISYNLNEKEYGILERLVNAYFNERDIFAKTEEVEISASLGILVQCGIGVFSGGMINGVYNKQTFKEDIEEITSRLKGGEGLIDILESVMLRKYQESNFFKGITQEQRDQISASVSEFIHKTFGGMSGDEIVTLVEYITSVTSKNALQEVTEKLTSDKRYPGKRFVFKSSLVLADATREAVFEINFNPAKMTPDQLKNLLKNLKGKIFRRTAQDEVTPVSAKELAEFLSDMSGRHQGEYIKAFMYSQRTDRRGRTTVTLRFQNGETIEVDASIWKNHLEGKDTPLKGIFPTVPLDRRLKELLMKNADYLNRNLILESGIASSSEGDKPGQGVVIVKQAEMDKSVQDEVDLIYEEVTSRGDNVMGLAEMPLAELLKGLDEDKTELGTYRAEPAREAREGTPEERRMEIARKRKEGEAAGTQGTQATQDEPSGAIKGGRFKDMKKALLEGELAKAPASPDEKVGDETVGDIVKRTCDKLLDERWPALESVLRGRGVPQEQIERARKALENLAFRWFNTIVENMEDYILGLNNALAVDIIEYLIEKGDLLEEYILHEALENIDDRFLDHEGAIEVTSAIFGRELKFDKDRHEPGQTLLGQALRAFIDEKAAAAEVRRKATQRTVHTVRSINSAENRNAAVIVVGKGPEGKKEEVERDLGPGLTRVGRATGRAGIGHRRQINHIMTYSETTAGAIASVVFNAVQEGRKLIASVKEYDSCDVVANYSDNVNVKKLIDELVDEKLALEFELSDEDRKGIKVSLLTEGAVVVEGVRITLVKDSYTDFAYPDLMFRYALARGIAYYETARSEANEAGMRSARELVLSHLKGGCPERFVSKMKDIKDAREFFSMLYTAGLKVEKIDFESIREYISSMIETSISL